MKCIIEEKRTQGVSVKYRDKKNGEEYLCLSGGFAWPGLKPGFAAVIGVQKEENKPDPIFKVLTELEEGDIPSLLASSFDLLEKYGAKCKEIPWMWYGDPEHGFNNFLHKFNAQNKAKEEEKQFFFLAPSPFLAQPNRFAMYCRVIYSLLKQGDKRLVFGPCARLRAYLDHLNEADVYAGSVEQHPAIAALGSVLSGLSEHRPWTRQIRRLKTPAELRIDLLEQGTLPSAEEELYLAQELSRAGGLWGDGIFAEQDDWEQDIYTRRVLDNGAQGDIVRGSGVE